MARSKLCTGLGLARPSLSPLTAHPHTLGCASPSAVNSAAGVGRLDSGFAGTICVLGGPGPYGLMELHFAIYQFGGLWGKVSVLGVWHVSDILGPCWAVEAPLHYAGGRIRVQFSLLRVLFWSKGSA